MLPPWMSSFLLLVSICSGQTTAVTVPYQAPSPDALKGEGLNSTNSQPSGFNTLVAAAPSTGNPVDRTNWNVTVDSYQVGTDNEPGNAIDGNPATFWHTEWMPVEVPLPHTFSVDMQIVQNVTGISYLPRQDGNSNGNIGQHQLFLSTDGVNYGSPVVIGAWLDDNTTKYSNIETHPARYVRLVALTEAGDRGPWTSMAEFNVFAVSSYTPPAKGLGIWGPTVDFPLVPVAAAIEYGTGNVLTWSSYAPDTFTGGNGGQTVTATFDPSSGSVTQRTVTNTDHDMFCPGLSTDANGTVVVTGGNNAPRTSLYDETADAWISGPDMNIPRGYQASTSCSDGRTFTIGGSWSGPLGGKNGEIYDPTTDTWALLSNALVQPMLTNDSAGIFRQDNHAWLFGWKSGSVFQAGPSMAMNWYGTVDATNGSQSPAGVRASDGDAMCGNAVMYNAVKGKVLTVGGSPDYSGSSATGNAHIITIGNPGSSDTNVQTLSPMSYPRIFANAVVLPNGEVFITGGQTVGDPFVDNNLDLTPEMWNPSNQKFTKMQPNSIARVYHSVGLLLLDGTILSGGGGLCGAGCSTNHFDAQIYTPPYLLNANGSPKTRPVITSVSAAAVALGATLTVTTDSAVTSMALMRYGSATHTVDTDQRRIPLTPKAQGTNTYTVVVPKDPGIALPGYWMLFAMNSAGVPSVAQTVQILL